MRMLSRLGAVATTAALATTMAFGATAQAAPFLPVQDGFGTGSTAVTDSPSTLVATVSGTKAKAMYTNKTDKDVSCFGIAATDEMVAAYTKLAKAGTIDLPSVFDEAEEKKLELATDAAVTAGKVTILDPDGTAVKVTDENKDEVDPTVPEEFQEKPIAAGESRTWEFDVPAGYLPSVAMLCVGLGQTVDPNNPGLSDLYFEYETVKATGGGVIGNLGEGSLGGGSSDSGSMAMGSLGGATESLGDGGAQSGLLIAAGIAVSAALAVAAGVASGAIALPALPGLPPM